MGLHGFELIMASNFWVVVLLHLKKSHNDKGNELHKKLFLDLLFGESWPITGPHSKVVDLEEAPHGKEFKILQQHLYKWLISFLIIQNQDFLHWIEFITLTSKELWRIFTTIWFEESFHKCKKRHCHAHIGWFVKQCKKWLCGECCKHTGTISRGYVHWLPTPAGLPNVDAPMIWKNVHK